IRTFWDSDLLLFNVEHLVIQRDVRAEMGWLPRPDMVRNHLQFDVKPRPRIRSVRQLFLRSNVDYITNQVGQLETRNRDLTFESLFDAGDRVFVRYSRPFDRITVPFRLQGGVTVTPGTYDWQSAQVRFTP